MALKTRSRGDWDWVFKKESKLSASQLAPPRVVDLGRTLSSPCMLTEEGVKESIRVLGSRAFEEGALAASGRQALQLSSFSQAERQKSAVPAATSTSVASNYVVPMTCNQIYGSRWRTAQKPVDKFGKQSCDVCLFVDHMNKTKTPYCPHLRL